LTVETPDGPDHYDIPATDDVARARPTDGSVVLLCVKSQDSAAALEALAGVFSPATPVVCMQNGVANERTALRWFRNVFGVVVNLPATFLRPGVVQSHATPVVGRLDMGRYPRGSDDHCASIAAAFETAGFLAEVKDDIMRWKYRKLIVNLTNAIEAISGRPSRSGRVGELTIAEGERVLAAAGIDVASAEEDRLRRGSQVVRPFVAPGREGGSTWQSLAREGGRAETDYLNGEIVLLGRLHGVPTPVNETLQQIIRRMVADRSRPGSVPEAELLGMLPDGVG
jgi:2-dehydropantoate 2-reductase